MESNLDLKFLFQNYLNNVREFFAQKISEMQAFQDAQTQEIEALTQKLMMLGTLAIILVVVIIILCIVLRTGKKRKLKKEKKKYRKAEADLRREEERLRQEREYYEEQNRRRVYVEDVNNNYGYSDGYDDRYDAGYGEGYDRGHDSRNQGGFTDQDFFDKYDDDEIIINEWTPGQKDRKPQRKSSGRKKGLFSRDTSYTVRKDASRTTQISGDLGDEYMDAINKTGYKEWDDENWQ